MSSKYEFIDGEKASYPIVKMCRWAEVSKSGFYEWRDRPASATAERRAGLRVRIIKIFADADGASGYRRVHAQLERDGIEAGPELVRQIMAVEGLVACQPRPFRITTTLSDGIAVGPADLCRRDFGAAMPGVKLVGDITYVRTWDGWVYLLVTWNQAAGLDSPLASHELRGRLRLVDATGGEVGGLGPPRSGGRVAADLGRSRSGAEDDRGLRARAC
ncbi:MAG: IS3 family transposase [Pseudonocardiaceae bacterium]